MTYKENRIYKL